jgi:hypothetical protein
MVERLVYGGNKREILKQNSSLIFLTKHTVAKKKTLPQSSVFALSCYAINKILAASNLALVARAPQQLHDNPPRERAQLYATVQWHLK